jgi:hypothetical protein
MQKISWLCIVLFALALAAPAHAKQYHGTYENDPPAKDDEGGNIPDNPKDEDTSVYKSTSDPVKYNSDGTERTKLEQEREARHRMEGGGSSGPTGQEDMFPHNGKLH